MSLFLSKALILPLKETKRKRVEASNYESAGFRESTMQRQVLGILKHITVGLKFWEVFKDGQTLSSHTTLHIIPSTKLDVK